MQLTILAEPNIEIKDSSLFTEITAEESVSINGGHRRCRAIANRVRNQVVFSGGRNFVVIYNL